MTRTQVFHFESNTEFAGDKSHQFARLLLYQCDPLTRQHILDTYGLEIADAGKKERLTYDGRKIGIGFFRTKDSDVTFHITPKEHIIDLKVIFQALAQQPAQKTRGKFEKLDALAPVEQKEGDFTPVFLLRLLDDISSFAQHLELTHLKKQEVFVQGGIKGRPQLQKSATRLLLGRKLGWFCEVLADHDLLDYIVVLVATAKDIVDSLKEWQGLMDATGAEPLAQLRTITSRLKIRDTSHFSMLLLSKVCRPPFPFGLRDILYKCLRYWKWKGRLQPAVSDSPTSGYHGMVVQLDRLFEDYVGTSWGASSEECYKWLPNPQYAYTLTNTSNSASLIRPLKLKPDHLLINVRTKKVVIVDAKYSLKVGSPDDIYQMIAYLAFCYPANLHHPCIDNTFQKYGVLVYPGKHWEVFSIDRFDHPLYLVTMPVTGTLRNQDICQFVQRITGM